jgi:hypothetical protein
MLNEQSNTKGVNSISPLGRNRIDALKINWICLQLSILLDHDDDDEYHPNRNAMKIANIIHNECDDEFHS